MDRAWIRTRTALTGVLVLALVGAVQLAGVPAAVAAHNGHQVWSASYDGTAQGDDSATSVTISADGSKVFVTGYSPGIGTGWDYSTAAYDSSTGAQLWTSRYDGPAHSYDHPAAVAGSPDGSMVFVTGYSGGSGTGYDYATVAYDATTGGELWVSRFDGRGNSDDAAYALAVSPDGSKVFVTGSGYAKHTGTDYATVGYDSASGMELWVSRHSGPGNGSDVARSIAVSPDGSAVFVTGNTQAAPGSSDVDDTTVAYDTAAGGQLWVRRYGPGTLAYQASALAVSADGSKVFVTGFRFVILNATDYVTVAYDAPTGKRLWVAAYDGPGHVTDFATAVAVSRDGTLVFVTGESSGGTTTSDDYATVAYDSSTGGQQWVARYDGSAHYSDGATGVAVSTTRPELFVTGYTWEATSGLDLTTVAYYSTSGVQLWASSFDGIAHLTDIASAIAVSPDGTTVFVAGQTQSFTKDFITVAYVT